MDFGILLVELADFHPPHMRSSFFEQAKHPCIIEFKSAKGDVEESVPVRIYLVFDLLSRAIIEKLQNSAQIFILLVTLEKFVDAEMNF